MFSAYLFIYLFLQRKKVLNPVNASVKIKLLFTLVSTTCNASYAVSLAQISLVTIIYQQRHSIMKEVKYFYTFSEGGLPLSFSH